MLLDQDPQLYCELLRHKGWVFLLFDSPHVTLVNVTPANNLHISTEWMGLQSTPKQDNRREEMKYLDDSKLEC